MANSIAGRRLNAAERPVKSKQRGCGVQWWPHRGFPPWHTLCNEGRMALDERPGFNTEGVHSTSSRRLISRLGPVLNRPLLIGAAAVLASLLCCGVLEGNNPFSEAKLPQGTASTMAPRHHHAARSEEVPLLFLVILGLAGLALSQTRPSPGEAEREVHFRAGKKVDHRQELPAVQPPQPLLVLPSGVIAREHHNHVVGLEPVGGPGILNE
jgi:hypothetical protein